MPKKMHTITFTPEALRLMAARDMRHAPLAPPPAPVDDDWIGTTEAAELTGYSQRRIHALCDEGFFVQGVDWKQRPSLNGKRSAGRIFIKRSALQKMNGQS